MLTRWRRYALLDNPPQLPVPAVQKWGTKNPIAIVPTNTGVSTWTVDVNGDNSLKTTIVGAPALLTTGTGTTAIINGNRTGALADANGSPAPPTTRTATFYNDGTLSIASWGGGPTTTGGAIVGRYVRVNAANPAGTTLPAATYNVAAVSVGSATHFTLKDSTGAVQTWGAGGTGSMGTASVTTREELEAADYLPNAGQAYQSMEKDRDYIIVPPCDPWGINPQRTPLDKPFGFGYLDGGHHVWITPGEVSFDTDWLANAGGIGINRLQSDPFTANSGGGYRDEVHRALRIREHTGTLHIEGVRFGGRYLFEVLDYSNAQVTGTVVTSSITAAPVRQIQRCQFGDAVNPVRNQQIQGIASTTSMLATTSTQVGDIWNVTTGGHAYRYNGGDRTQLASYTDLGAGVVPNQHSGGDCLQDWGISGLPKHYVYDCTFYTMFQALFFAWNDQPPTNLASAGGPGLYDMRRCRIHAYSSGPWVIYITKGGLGDVSPPVRFEDIWVTTHGFTSTLANLTHLNGRNLTATGTDAISAWVDGTATADADLKVSGPARSIRYATTAWPLFGADKPGGDYATPARTGGNYRPGAWVGAATFPATVATAQLGWDLDAWDIDGWE